MSAQTVQLELPETVYQQIQRAAEKTHRPLNDVLVEAVSAVAPVPQRVGANGLFERRRVVASRARDDDSRATRKIGGPA